MKNIIVACIAACFAVGCTEAPRAAQIAEFPTEVGRYYDKENGVVCYITYKNHISCVKVK